MLDDAATTRGLRARGRELLLDGAAAARWAVVDGISAVSDVRLDRVTAAQDRVTAALGASLPCVIAAPDHPSAAPEALVDYPTSPPRIDARLPAASSAAPGSSAPAFTRLRTVAATWDTRAHTLPRSRTATADRALGASRGPRNAAVRAPAPCSDATAASGASASAPCDRPELVIARPPHAFVAHPAPAALPPRPAVAVPDARPG